MTGTLSFGIASTVGPDVAAAVAPDVARLGYAMLWTNDGGQDPGLPVLAAAQRAAPGLRSGVGVVPVDRRPAREIADQVAALHIDVGRAVIGVGSGRAEHPVPAVRAAVRDLRAALGPRAVVAVAALGPLMCRLAGEVADVALLNWMTPERLAWARERVREGEARAGRAAGSVVLASYVRVAVGPDAAARLAAEAGRYAAIPQYARGFAAMGVDPGSVGIAVADPREVRGGLAPYRDALDETVVRALPRGSGTEGVLEIATAGIR